MKNNPMPWRPDRLLAWLLPLLLLAAPALAQLKEGVSQTAAATADARPEMADALRQSGKIYVVVLVVVIIVVGLLLYLVRLDGKVSRLERELE